MDGQQLIKLISEWEIWEWVWAIPEAVHELHLRLISSISPYLWNAVWFVSVGFIQLTIINDLSYPRSGFATLVYGEWLVYGLFIMGLLLAYSKNAKLMTLAAMIKYAYALYLVLGSPLFPGDLRILLAMFYLVDGALGGSWGAWNVDTREALQETAAELRATKERLHYGGSGR